MGDRSLADGSYLGLFVFPARTMRIYRAGLRREQPSTGEATTVPSPRSKDDGGKDLKQLGRAPAQLVRGQAAVAPASAWVRPARAWIIPVGSMPSRLAT